MFQALWHYGMKESANANFCPDRGMINNLGCRSLSRMSECLFQWKVMKAADHLHNTLAVKPFNQCFTPYIQFVKYVPRDRKIISMALVL